MDRYHYGKSTVLPVKTYDFQTKPRKGSQNRYQNPAPTIGLFGKSLTAKPRPTSAAFGRAPPKITKQTSNLNNQFFLDTFNLAVVGTNKPIEKENISLSDLEDYDPMPTTIFRASSRGSARPKLSTMRKSADQKKKTTEKHPLILMDMIQNNKLNGLDDDLNNVSIDTEAALPEETNGKKDLKQLSARQAVVTNALPGKKKLHGARKLKTSVQPTQSSSILKNFESVTFGEAAANKTQRAKSSNRTASRLFKTPRESENSEPRKNSLLKSRQKDDHSESRAVIPITLSFNTLEQPEESQSQLMPRKVRRPSSANPILIKLKGYNKVHQALRNGTHEHSQIESIHNGQAHAMRMDESQETLRASKTEMRFKNRSVSRQRGDKPGTARNNNRPNDASADASERRATEGASYQSRAHNTMNLLQNRVVLRNGPDFGIPQQGEIFTNTSYTSQRMGIAYKNPWWGLAGSQGGFKNATTTHSHYSLERASTGGLNKGERMSVEKLFNTNLQKSQNNIPVHSYMMNSFTNNLWTEPDFSPKSDFKFTQESQLYDPKTVFRKPVSPDKVRDNKESNDSSRGKKFSRASSANPARRAVLSEVHDSYKFDPKPITSQERRSFNDTMDSKQILMGLQSPQNNHSQRENSQVESFFDHDDSVLPLGARYHG